MATNLGFLILLICTILIGVSSSDWNILNRFKPENDHGVQISLKNLCESWRMNVELHNIRDFEVVPDECVDYIAKYMSSTQYKVDSQRTVEECSLYVTTSCGLKKDGSAAWIFDVDDTLLSTLPYYKNNGFGGRKLNSSDLEEWMKQGKAPALEHSLGLFNQLKGLGVRIFLVSSRSERLRKSTIDNLVDVGYHGWTALVLRGADDEVKDVQRYKADVRRELGKIGYRVWGILGDQWSSIDGPPTPQRTFKLPNPLYYVA